MDEIREPGKWCAFEVKFKETDTEFLSLEEHSALMQARDQEIADLEENYSHVYQCAKEWMEKYDELKNKYEPMIAVTSEALSGDAGRNDG